MTRYYASCHWIGWRFWLAGPGEIDGVTRPILASPFDAGFVGPPDPRLCLWRLPWLADPAETDGPRPDTGHVDDPYERLWLDALPRIAWCPPHTHAVPDPACECGYRIVRRLPDLVNLVRSYSQMHSTPALRILRKISGHPSIDFPTQVAFGQVEGTGSVHAGALNDPSDTVRVERIRLIGPLLLSPPVANYAEEFEEYYSVVAYPGRGDYYQWLDRVYRRPAIAYPGDWPDPEMESR